MYSNSVSRTKTAATVLCAAVVAASCILAVWCMTHGSLTVGIIVLAILAAVSCAQHLFLSAFSSLTQETADAKKAYENLLSDSRTKAVSSRPAALEVKNQHISRSQAPEQVKVYPTVKATAAKDGMVTCPCCGLTQYANRTRCFDCGAYFEK